MIQVRRATLEDRAWLLHQLQEFADSAGTKRRIFSENDEHAKVYIARLIVEHVVFVAEQVEGEFKKKVGLIAGLEVKHPYNPKINLLSENFWWVSPEFRGTSAGARLLIEFTNYGKEHCDWITMSLQHNSPIKREAMEKRGYKIQEEAFLMEV